ncbi:MAG: hypothetical protein QM608_01575 [Caulobacter sp.]
MSKQAPSTTPSARKPVAPALIGSAHKLTKNGSTGNIENSRGHR